MRQCMWQMDGGGRPFRSDVVSQLCVSEVELAIDKAME